MRDTFQRTILQLRIFNFKQVHIQAKEKPKDRMLFTLLTILYVLQQDSVGTVYCQSVHMYTGNMGLLNLQL